MGRGGEIVWIRDSISPPRALQLIFQPTLDFLLHTCHKIQMSQFSAKKFLSEFEEAQLRHALLSASKRDALMIRLLRVYGMRASELLGLTLASLDIEGRLLHVSGLKGGLDRALPLKDPDLWALCELAKGLKPNDRFFPITYNRLGDIWRRYRPPGKKLHSLRHSCAIGVYRKTKDLLKVKRLLGHKSITTTMVYQDFCFGIEELREALS